MIRVWALDRAGAREVRGGQGRGMDLPATREKWCGSYEMRYFTQSCGFCPNGDRRVCSSTPRLSSATAMTASDTVVSARLQAPARAPGRARRAARSSIQSLWYPLSASNPLQLTECSAFKRAILMA